jgi:hypothetical protein
MAIKNINMIYYIYKHLKIVWKDYTLYLHFNSPKEGI